MYFSVLLGARVKDSQGAVIGRMSDVAIRLAGPELPNVIRLHIRHRGAVMACAIDRVDRLDARTVVLRDGPAYLAPVSRGPGEVFLEHDVLDKQVIDLREPEVVRVNDIILERSGDGWRVRGVDTSIITLLSRLLPRALRRLPPDQCARSWTEIELLNGGTVGEESSPRHPRLALLHPADIARVADAVPPSQATEIVASLSDALAADALEEMVDERQVTVLDTLERGRASEILAEMAPDAAADVLADLEPATVDDLLRRMSAPNAAGLHALLTYPKDTAGGLMTTDLVLVPRGLPVNEALDYLRPQMRKPDWVYYVYVVEEIRSRILVGVLSLRDLFLAEPTQRVDEIMARTPRQVRPDTPASAVARIMSEYNLIALPVTDARGQLLGIVSVDDALEVILPRHLRRSLPRVFS